MKQYIGITIGPIFDTISDASTPAALWFASTLFSDITRRICIKLKSTFDPFTLYSPYFNKEDEKGLMDGVGKYHDRVIFSVDDMVIDKTCQEQGKTLNELLDDLLNDVKRRTMTQIEYQKEDFDWEDGEALDKRYKAEELTFLEQYIQINYIVMSEKEVGDTNCILKLSPYLDALELMKSFPENDTFNPIRRIMESKEEPETDDAKKKKDYHKRNKKSKKKGRKGYPGRKDNNTESHQNQTSNNTNGTGSKNRLVKASWLFKKGTCSNNQFMRNGEKNICNIEAIANCNTKIPNTLKYGDYYAIVSADADGMGTFLNTITNDEVTCFSECCMRYAEKASRMIGAFYGMTIYAGGDDLLFLVPVKNPDDKRSVFELCQDISVLFKNIVEGKCEEGENGEKKAVFENKPIPTISFGISIQFYKYPLYEALNQSRQMLEEAKSRKFNVSVQTGEKQLADSTEKSEDKKLIDLKKNCVVFNLEKHSGRSVRVLVGNEALPSFCKFVTAISETSDDKKLKGLISKLEKLYPVITTLDTVKARPMIARMKPESGYIPSEEEKQVFEDWKKELWDNLFDNQGQVFAKGFIQYVCEFYYTNLIEHQMRCAALYTENNKITEDKDETVQEKDMYPNKTLNVLIEILRYCMFLKEKAGE